MASNTYLKALRQPLLRLPYLPGLPSTPLYPEKGTDTHPSNGGKQVFKYPTQPCTGELNSRFGVQFQQVDLKARTPLTIYPGWCMCH